MYELQVAYGLDIGVDKTHVALVSFSNDTIVNFKFNPFKNKDEVLTAMSLR